MIHSKESTFFDQTWCGIDWSAWIPFTRARMDTLPAQPGVYRLRVAGSLEELFYIGASPTWGLGPYLTGLHQAAMRDRTQMPYGGMYAWDYLAAPALWTWRDAEGSSFECSVGTIDATRQDIEGLMCALLWEYRRAQGCSPRANYGRFHPHYRASATFLTARGRQRLRGARLPEGQTNPAAGESHPPLLPMATFRFADTYWMGLRWGGWIDLRAPDSPRGTSLPHGPAIYAVADAQTWNELLFIGYAWDMSAAYSSIARRPWDCPLPMLRAYTKVEQDMPEHQLRELAGDLIGTYFSIKRKPPRFQF